MLTLPQQGGSTPTLEVSMQFRELATWPRSQSKEWGAWILMELCLPLATAPVRGPCCGDRCRMGVWTKVYQQMPWTMNPQGVKTRGSYCPQAENETVETKVSETWSQSGIP